MNRKIKNILIFVGIGLILCLIYIFLIKKDEPKENLESSKEAKTEKVANTSVSNDSNIQEIQDKISSLLKIEKIVLDDSIFAKATFKNLEEHTVILERDTDPGRPNPFAPVVPVLDTTLPGDGTNLNPTDPTLNNMKTPILPQTQPSTVPKR